MFSDSETNQSNIQEVLAEIQQSCNILFIPAIFSEEPIVEIMEKFFTNLISCLQAGENCEVVMKTALPTIIFCLILLGISGITGYYFFSQPDRSNILIPSDKDYKREDELEELDD